jgi:hypothetical protein
LRLRDRGNTPLGTGAAPASAIRGVAVTVEYSPASAVESIEIVRTGVAAGLATRFETQLPGPARHSWIAAFDEDVVLAGGARVVAEVRLAIAEDAPPGPLDLRLAAETTALSNAGGTLVETAANGLLDLVDGRVEIAASCTTEDTLCLLDDRFLVGVAWTVGGRSGTGHAVRLTHDAGYFWFFNDDNVEVAIKVLDGRSVNGRFWVFYGALSNVEYEITVTDSATGRVGTYRNPAGRFASVGDTDAFPGAGVRSPAPAVEKRRSTSSREKKQSGCVADELTLCLLDGRFRLEAQWRDFSGGSGVGRAAGLTDDAGYFWFFSENNVEIVVKTLDGRNVNGRFWVFFGALSNVEFTLRVTDTETGDVKTYENPLGTFASVGDTSAF